MLFTHVEECGVLFPIFRAVMGSAVQRTHDAFNDALKTRKASRRRVRLITTLSGKCRAEARALATAWLRRTIALHELPQPRARGVQGSRTPPGIRSWMDVVIGGLIAGMVASSNA